MMQWFEAPAIDYTVLSPARAAEIRRQLAALDDSLDAALRWSAISRNILRPSDPFPIHRDLFRENYRAWNAALGPAPAVIPAPEAQPETNVGRWLRELGFDRYDRLHEFSRTQPEEFLSAAVQKLGIRFRKPFDRAMDLAEGVERPYWFKGACMNIADSVLRGDPERIAIVYGKEGRGGIERWPLSRLESLSGRIANGLGRLGFRKGDRIAVAMPMTAECVAIYLGIVRAGMAVVSIADSFAADEIASRLRIAAAKAVFTQDVIVRGERRHPLYARVQAAGAPAAVVIPADGAADGVADGVLEEPLRNGDRSWADFLPGEAAFENAACDPRDAINVLFSSGTTGDPKAIPWDHATAVRCALDGFVHQDIQPGDVVAWPTNIGWMMGPWLIFAALINEGSIALYDGTPQTRGFAQFVQAAGVRILGVVPSLVRSWRNSGCLEGVDWTGIKSFSSTGESSNVEDMLFLMAQAGYKPVMEYCGGTEIGGGYFSSTPIHRNSPASFAAKALGTDFVILDDAAQQSDNGELFLVPPSLGLSIALLNQDHHTVYFQDCPAGPSGEILRRHGDQVQAQPGGCFRALGRADDTMNLGGIKVGSAELERAMNRVAGVVETAAIAVPPPGGGPSLLVVYAVVAPGSPANARDLQKTFQERLREDLNPLFKIADVQIVDALPRTASNKVMRRRLRAEYVQTPGKP